MAARIEDSMFLQIGDEKKIPTRYRTPKIGPFEAHLISLKKGQWVRVPYESDDLKEQRNQTARIGMKILRVKRTFATSFEYTLRSLNEGILVWRVK